MDTVDILTANDQVAALARELAAEPSLAVDLEADSMHNYRERVCLIQVSTLQRTVLIDPLAVSDLSPLRALLADASIRKIFHAADYDLRCLKRDFDLEVHGLFDTMVSAQLLGEERIGLADLLRKYFAVELDKKFQRADWSQRPLGAGMIRYAAEDTRHLHRLSELFAGRLTALGRMAWAVEEFTLLEEVRFADPEGPLWLRFKGAAALTSRELGILDELLQWREREGARLNRPVYKILGNQQLQELARRKPQDKNSLGEVEGLSARLAERYGKALLAAVSAGMEIPEVELPVFPRPQRRAKDPDSEERVKVLKRWRQESAAAYGIEPGVLINNTLLEALARINPRTKADLDTVVGLKNWQKKELGDELLGVLGGAPRQSYK
jgi:ribonuclease D